MELAKIRIMGSEPVVTAAIERIGQVLDMAYDGNLLPQRHGEGVRAYLDVAAPGNGSASSPRALAEDAKRRRDIDGEISTLRAADQELRNQPWFPIQAGDVVVWSVDLPGGRHGETLLAVEDPDYPTQGGAPLKKVSETLHDLGDDADEDQDAELDDEQPVSLPGYEDFYDLWFEAGPSSVAVIRQGQLVHGRVEMMAR